MTGPMVSVIVTTFNSARFLRECLDSVFAQTLGDYEVIVVDNCSTDGTHAIVESYGTRVRWLSSERDVLPGVTRNIGMRAATGRYIAFLDSDDAWYSNKLAEQVAFMEANPNVAMCHSYVHVMDERSVVQMVRHEESIPPTGPCFQALLKHCFVSTSSVMVRRSVVLDEKLFFPSDPKTDRTGEDYLFFLLIARRHNIGLVDQVLAKYRWYGTSITSRFGWRIVPENTIVHETILTNPVYWAGIVPRRQPLEVFVNACLGNAYYWRMRRRTGYALHFNLRALRRDPCCGRAWAGLVKSFFQAR